MNNTTINSDDNPNNVTDNDDFDRQRHCSSTNLSRLHRSYAEEQLQLTVQDDIEELFKFKDEKELQQVALIRYRQREIEHTMKDSKNIYIYVVINT